MDIKTFIKSIPLILNKWNRFAVPKTNRFVMVGIRLSAQQISDKPLFIVEFKKQDGQDPANIIVAPSIFFYIDDGIVLSIDQDSTSTWRIYEHAIDE